MHHAVILNIGFADLISYLVTLIAVLLDNHFKPQVCSEHVFAGSQMSAAGH